jgi:acetoin utilization protein AcuB
MHQERPTEATMRVQDVMTAGVQTAKPTGKADDAWELMRAKRIHHLVVTDGARIVGVLSDRDAGGRRGASVRAGRLVADLMTVPAVAVSPETTVRKAANLMRGRSIGCLVVEHGGRAVGIVTVSDLLDILGRGGDRGVEKTKRWTLKHRAPHRERARSTGPW